MASLRHREEWFHGSSRWELPLLGFASLAVFLIAHWAALIHPHVINDDVRQQIYWMQQWREPGLFREDWLSDYARQYVPWGVQGIYWAASFAEDPVWFSKILPGILFVGLAGCLHGIGRRLGGPLAAWCVVAVYWLMPFFLDNLAGGLARSFAAPLLALLWLSWSWGRPWGMALALVLQALCIPYMVPISLLAVGLAWAAGKLFKGSPPPFPARWGHVFILLLATGLTVLWNHSFDSSGFGPMVEAREMTGRPEFMDRGRYPILPVPSPLWEMFVRPLQEAAATSQTGWALLSVVGCLFLAGTAGLGGWRVAWREIARQLQPALFLGFSSLIMYGLAWAFLLRFFVPSRYIMFTANLFLCVALGLCLHAVLIRWEVPKTALAALLVAAVILGGLRLRGMGLFDYSEYGPLARALARTPENSLIAGHPQTLDNVPVFAKRSAVATFELAHPWSKGLWGRLKPRLEDLFAAYYAEDPETVREFSRRHGVRFWVVDSRYYSRSFLEGQPFFAPFDDEIRAITRRRERFALLTDPNFRRQTVGDHLQLVEPLPEPWDRSTIPPPSRPKGVLPSQGPRQP